MKKNLIKVTIILSMLLLTLIPLSVNAATSGTCGDNLTWKLDDSGLLTISGIGEMESYNEYNMPPWNSNKNNILNIKTENGVTSIGSNSFSNCKNLKNISLGNNIEIIEHCAFLECENLQTINIPSSLKSIEYDAFYECNELIGVYITDIKSWCNIEFDSNPLNYAGKLYVNNTLVEDIVIPDGVSEIKEHAFRNCQNIKSVTIPDTTVSINHCAFYSCTNLKTISFGNNIIDIEDGAFGECISITNVTLPNTVKNIGSSAFESCHSLTNITLGNNVETIGSSAFACCSNLTEISIPDNVTIIEDFTFTDCINLKNIYWGQNITSIGNSAFARCFPLTNITIPNKVTNIGEFAFRDCESLTTITIPYSVNFIGICAFEYCDKLSYVYYGGNEENWSDIDIGSYNDPLYNANIFYNASSLNASIKTNKDNNSFIVMPSNIPNGSTIIFVCYNDKQMVYVEPFTYAGEETKTFTPDKEYDKVKVLVWENLETCVPLCEAEDVPLN